jgi:diaminohydroxyphosphoribosylaminopyrimidine deaminase/5-amino-6-(5-phosphoribosylamino)uracil reductase
MLFVTLEPCSTYGKTPPCTDKIIESGIKEVIIGTLDPNPKNRKKGIKKLKKNGIKVITGILKKQAEELNEDFAVFIRKKRPFVTLKAAQSLDGKIATYKKDSKWISSLESRRYVHRLRALHDAVLVGIQTVIEDDPQLNVRLYKSYRKQPKRIILDSSLRIPLKSKVLSNLKDKKTIIATTKYAPLKKIKKLTNLGATVLKVRSKDKRVNLKALLEKLADMDIVSLLVEGGLQVFTSFINQHLADRLIVVISPKLIGGKEAFSFYEGKGIRKIKNSMKLRDIKYRESGPDLIIEGYF